MVFDWATTGPYEGGTVVFIEYYRGWSIYFLTHWGLQFYGAVDPYGVEKSTFHGTTTGIRKLIDGWILQYPFTTILSFSYPTSLPAGVPIGELRVTARNTGGSAGYLTVAINSDRYTVAYGSSYPTKVAPGDTFNFYLTPEIDPNMPNHDYTLTATNDDGSSSITGTIALAAPEPPDVRITTLNYPSEARVGEEVEITWYWKNEGGDGGVPQWTRIRDLDTGGLVSPGEMGFALVPGGVAGVTIYPNMPNWDWRLRAETGYEDTITDTRDFTISIEPEDVIVYVWDQTSGSYLGGDWGKVTLDGVAKDPSGGHGIFHNIEVGRHTISIDVPGYDFDHWDSMGGDSWVEVLIDNPNSPSTGITTQSGGPGFLRAWVTESLPASATVTVKGRATGGYPTPTIRLYVYDNGVQVGYKDFSSISIGTWYTYEKIITGAGIHRVYGRMRLRNVLGSYYKNTETVEFELG